MRFDNQRGYALITVLIAVSVLLAVGAATISISRSGLRSAAVDEAETVALHIAEAGVERALAQLDADKVTGAELETYTWNITEPFGAGAYDAAIDHDTSFPSDPRRKIITATGTSGSGSATVRAHSLVQTDPCDSTIMTAASGTARMVTNASLASLQLFNGDWHSNGNAALDSISGVLFDGAGAITAKGSFSAGGVTLLTQMAATLTEETGSYSPAVADIHILGAPVAGLHFANGIANHGVTAPVDSRHLPYMDWEAIKADPATIVVNASNVPIGTWDAATDTWMVANLNLPGGTAATYYVEGNANVVAAGFSATANGRIVARGWIAVDSLSITAVSLPGQTTRLSLIAEESVVMGRPVVDFGTFGLTDETTAILNSATGLLSPLAGIAHNDEILAYSEKGSVWLKLMTAAIASTPKICALGRTGTTVAIGAGLLSTIVPLY